jgi:hypothetical protein
MDAPKKGITERQTDNLLLTKQIHKGEVVPVLN